MESSVYVSLDEAREELEKRWNNAELKRKIEIELGGRFIKEFANRPRGVLFRQLCSPDNGFTFFFQCAKYINSEPLVLEFHEDIFVHFNDEKKGLGRLRIVLNDGAAATLDIMNFHENEKKPLSRVAIKSGESLIDFHHNLFSLIKCRVDILENTNWFHEIGHAQDYYYYLLLHFIAHGALVETFLNESDSSEDEFTKNIIIPTLNLIKKKFGLSPLIIRLYPEKQDEKEDFYWWCYPTNVNDFLVGYANENKLPFKKIKI